MKLTIRNMVCDRCVESVRSLFGREGIALRQVDLGRVETVHPPDSKQLDRIGRALEEKGFELVQDRETEKVEQIKVALLEYLKHLEEQKKPEKLSVFVSKRLHYNYSYLSKIFSEKAGGTVEGYFIRLRIERVKELLSYRRLTLSEIAWQLKYSSVQYLSNQFRKVTGMTVTDYLKQEEPDRKTLDRIGTDTGRSG